MTLTVTLEWIPVDVRLPDDDTLVLLALNDDDTWTGYRDGAIWRYADSMPLTAERVTHWAQMPHVPIHAQPDAKQPQSTFEVEQVA